jgi:hypothetical protein
MLKRHHHCAHASVWAACFLLVVAGSVVAAGSGGADRVALRPVAVETVGIAAMGTGLSEGEVYSAALANARRNVLIQAHAALHAQMLVSNRRIVEEAVCVRSAGYVQEMRVLESGVVPGSDPPIYQVRVRALVHPLDETHVGAAAALETDLTPVLTLDVAPGAGPALRDGLAQELTRCGMRVVEASASQPAIAVHVAVLEAVELTGPGMAWWQGELKDAGTSAVSIRWEMTVGAESDAAAPPASGRCLLPTDDSALARVLPHLSVTMAQAALRVWCAPRPTRVLFVNTTGSESLALSAAARDITFPGDSSAEPPHEGMLLSLKVAGNPAAAVASLLNRAGLQGRFALSEASLSSLTYARASQPTVPGANAP